jgi:uncharacterized repeat protein (TIGR02543 family)
MSSSLNSLKSKSLLVGLLVIALLTGLGILPAKADSPTDIQLGAPTVIAVQGPNLGDILLTVQFTDPTPTGQLFTITVTDPQAALLSQVGDVTQEQVAAITVPSLPVDTDLTVVVTAQAWLSQDGLSNYLASDSAPVTVQAKGSVSGFQAPTWIDSNLGSFVAGVPYLDAVQAQSDAPIAYSLTNGSLPNGISLDPTTGVLTGTPTSANPYSFEISALTQPNNIAVSFSGLVTGLRTCEDYSNASFASNILLNQDGTPIGCDYDNQAADLRPQGWDNTFDHSFGANSNASIKYATRLGWACDDCSIGSSGQTWNGTGIPIGFDINFFGTTYSNLFVNSNGSVSFGQGSSNYNQPLNQVLNGVPGIAPFAVDLDNRDVSWDSQSSWGAGSARHPDFFYWGRTTYEGKQAFVVTWMNSQIFDADGRKDFNTFQLVIVDNGSGDADYILNYGSLQDLHNNAGYRDFNTCTGSYWSCEPHLAAGFGSSTSNGTLYASLQDQTGYLYNGAVTSTALDGGENALASSSLNSDVPGRFIYHMVSGYVPEVATVPSAPLNLSATNSEASVTATWDPPARQGGAPLTGYVLRYRLAGTNNAYVEVTSSNLSAVINGLDRGNYSFQVAANNEIGRGPFSRSFLLQVAGPVYADMTAYLEAFTYSQGLNSVYFTPESWANLVAATSVTVTRNDSQATVDAQTLLINTALSGLVFTSISLFSVNYTDYNAAVQFANSLHEADFNSDSWAALAAELAVDVSTADQQTVDNQTALINAALNALILNFAGQGIQMSDLSAYNAAVASANSLIEAGYSTGSWATLQATLGVTVTRDNAQADVDAATAAINSAIAALEVLSDLSAYNQALSDAAQYSQATVTPDTWNALQLALGTVVSSLTQQADVDAATAAINAAIANLVFTANMTAYNAAVAQASTMNEANYTAESWAALQSALAIQVAPLTASQVFVDIATVNITSAISALVVQLRHVTYDLQGGSGSAPVQTDLPNAGSFVIADAPTRDGYTFAGWSDGTEIYPAGDTYVVGQVDLVFTATWTATSHVVIYDLNGAAGLAPTQLAKVTDSTFIVATGPSNAGYTFSGWSDGTNVYQPGATYTVSSVNVTMTAQWTAHASKSITFGAGGGSGSGPTSVPSTLLDGQFFALPSNTFTRPGFDFVGWSQGATVREAGMTLFVSDLDLNFVAKWAKHVSVKLVVSGYKFQQSVLSAPMYQKLRRWAQSHMSVRHVTCTGYTGWNQNHLSTAALEKLGKARAKAACMFLKTLNSKLVVDGLSAIRSSRKLDGIRKAVVIVTH